MAVGGTAEFVGLGGHEPGELVKPSSLMLHLLEFEGMQSCRRRLMRKPVNGALGTRCSSQNWRPPQRDPAQSCQQADRRGRVGLCRTHRRRVLLVDRGLALPGDHWVENSKPLPIKARSHRLFAICSDLTST